MAGNKGTNQTSRTLIIFACAAVALAMLILATQVEMPLQAILIAVAFSEIIFLALILLGKILPDKRR